MPVNLISRLSEVWKSKMNRSNGNDNYRWQSCQHNVVVTYVKKDDCHIKQAGISSSVIVGVHDFCQDVIPNREQYY